MDTREILTDASRRPLYTAAVLLKGIGAKTLNAHPAPGANSISWLVWHAARQMDVQLAELTGRPTVWERDGWAQKLGVDRGPDDFGFGDGPEQVAALRIEDSAALEALLVACVEELVAYDDTLSPEDLDEVIDDRWDPPVTRGVRIVSIIDDAVVHLGQASYARGLLEGWKLGV